MEPVNIVKNGKELKMILLTSVLLLNVKIIKDVLLTVPVSNVHLLQDNIVVVLSADQTIAKMDRNFKKMENA